MSGDGGQSVSVRVPRRRRVYPAPSATVCGGCLVTAVSPSLSVFHAAAAAHRTAPHAVRSGGGGGGGAGCNAERRFSATLHLQVTIGVGTSYPQTIPSTSSLSLEGVQRNRPSAPHPEKLSIRKSISSAYYKRFDVRCEYPIPEFPHSLIIFNTPIRINRHFYTLFGQKVYIFCQILYTDALQNEF